MHAADWLYLAGMVNMRHAPPSPLARMLLAWERECARMRRTEERWPTLAEQRAFMWVRIHTQPQYYPSN